MGPDGPTCPRLLLDLLLMAPLSFPSSHGQFWQLHVFPCHCGGVLTVYLVGTPCNWWPSTLEGVWCSFAPPLEEGLVVVAVSATPLSCCWDSSWLWWWPWTFLQRGDHGSISVQEEQRGTKQPDKLEGSVWVLQPGGLCKAHQEIPHPARSTLTEKSRMK